MPARFRWKPGPAFVMRRFRRERCAVRAVLFTEIKQIFDLDAQSVRNVK